MQPYTCPKQNSNLKHNSVDIAMISNHILLYYNVKKQISASIYPSNAITEVMKSIYQLMHPHPVVVMHVCNEISYIF